jgi:outer membrane protein OmpA-like peptidoglycan-associated protein
MPGLTRIAGLFAAAALIIAPGLAAADTVQGMIISHDGQKVTVRGGGADTTVTLTDATTIQAIVGVLGVRKEDHPATDLIAGLAVSVDTVQNGAELDAASITFKDGDLKTAMAAQAAMYPEQQKLAAARQKIVAAQAETERRLSEVGQYEQKAVTRVYFASGSVAINAQGSEDLKSIAAQAAGIQGASFRIVGHADSTGNAAANQRLSDQRASAVTAYLLKHCNVPPSSIMAVAGVGQDLPQDTDDLGGAKNRRVAVFVLVSKASEGTSHVPAADAPNPMAPPPPN